MWSTIFTIALLVVSVCIIVFVLLQPGKSSGLSGAITGGAEQLFGKKKARGIEAVLARATVVLAILFFLLALGVAYFL
jgi:preprotein translocase subunit SecG